MKTLKARRARCDLQDYQNERYIAHLLDQRHFDAVNTTKDTSWLYNAGLDAIDSIVQGSMVCSFGMYDRNTIVRGMTLKEQSDMNSFVLE